jgi:hypothetical protein
LAEKLAEILDKSLNEIYYGTSLLEIINELVEVIERNGVNY